VRPTAHPHLTLKLRSGPIPPRPTCLHEVRIVAKSACCLWHIHPSVRMYPTGRISVKIDNVEFYENLSRKSKCGFNLA
jgi:hypothetical protein